MCWGVVAHEDVYLVQLPAEANLRDGASPGEALKARSPHGHQRLERFPPRRSGHPSGRRDRRPADHNDDGSFGRNAVGRDLTARRLRLHAAGPDDEQRARVGHRAGTRWPNLLPALGSDDADTVGGDDPDPSTAAPPKEEGQSEQRGNFPTDLT